MIKRKKLRTSLRGLILKALKSGGLNDFAVVNDRERVGANRYIVFSLADLPKTDGRYNLDLEINVVGPDSDGEQVETAADLIAGALDGMLVEESSFTYYLYSSTRNFVDGDPHTARQRLTFDLYLYERTNDYAYL